MKIVKDLVATEQRESRVLPGPRYSKSVPPEDEAGQSHPVAHVRRFLKSHAQPDREDEIRLHFFSASLTHQPSPRHGAQSRHMSFLPQVKRNGSLHDA